MSTIKISTRLGPSATHSIFRTILKALANPGRVLELDTPPEFPPAALLPLVLSDFTCTVALVGEGAAEAEVWLAAATGAIMAPPAMADQVVVLDPTAASPLLIEDLRRGTSLAPEEGARLALAVSELESGPLRLRLSGPGVRNHMDLALAGPSAAAFSALRRVNAAFPMGIDTWLFAPDGRIAALSRSTQIIVEDI